MKIITKLAVATVALLWTASALADGAASPAASATDAATPAPGEPAQPAPPSAEPATATAQGPTLSTVTYQMPEMTMATAGAAAFGMFGALATLHKGAQLVRDNQVSDPAIAISAKLAPLVAAKYQAGNMVVLTDQDTDNDDAKGLAKLAGASGIVMDVESRQWMVGYFAFDWTHYKLIYAARAHLIDAATGKTIAKSDCSFTTADDPSPPDSDGVAANNAAWVKNSGQKATDSCLATFAKELVGQ